MKQKYEKPTCQVLLHEQEDIVTSSNPSDEENWTFDY